MITFFRFIQGHNYAGVPHTHTHTLSAWTFVICHRRTSNTFIVRSFATMTSSLSHFVAIISAIVVVVVAVVVAVFGIVQSWSANTISINRAFGRIIHLTSLAILIEHFGQLNQSVIEQSVGQSGCINQKQKQLSNSD